jgi:hypothetical protein
MQICYLGEISMSIEHHWEVADEVAGSLQAEILRGLLEAQGIPVILSQEGIAHSSYAVTVGPLGRVQILVPVELIERARQVLEDYRSGAFDTDETFDVQETEEEQDDSTSSLPSIGSLLSGI